MLTEYEARKLQDDMRRELLAGPDTMWRCAAGLVILLACVLIGASVLVT